MNIQELYKIFLKYPDISTDSRNIKQDSIFFALKGENFNGNNFAEAAIENGALYAVVDEQKDIKNVKFIYVDDVLKTLQKLAQIHRNNFKIPVIGITGTNGKTTTKELINAVLSSKYEVLATQGNLNNHIGVPLTILSLNNKHEIAIIEMGANHIGEIGELCKISQPNYGIITNIGKAHLEGFGSIEGIKKTKKDLYISVNQNKGKIFVNADNPQLIEIAENIEKIKYGQKSEYFCSGEILKNDLFLSLKYKCMNNIESIKTNLVGDYNFENVLAAISIGFYFNINNELIKKTIENYQPTNNRSQIIHTKNNTLILDAYNANPTSMEKSIMNFSNYNTTQNKVIILGDMLELGEYTIDEHIKILNLVKTKNFNQVILIGPVFSEIYKNTNWKCFDNSTDANIWISKNSIINSLILIKGSRGIKMEKIINVL